MKYKTPGEYEIKYTATDGCGNEIVSSRTVTVYQIVHRSALYNDGTFIINEKSTDHETNQQRHGDVYAEYPPLSETDPYVFSSGSDRLWLGETSEIRAVEFGSEVAPTSMAYWFQNCSNLTSIDWTNFDGSNCTSIRAMMAGTALTSFAPPEMPNLETLRFVCNACPNLTTVDMSGVNALGVTDINAAFQGCYALETIDLTGLEGTVDACSNAFSNASNGPDMVLTTIYAVPGLDFSQATASNNVFRACVSLVGGQGTTYDPSFTGKGRAHLDGGTSNPGYFTSK